MAVSARSPHGVEGSDLYDALNCAKRDVTLNLKHPDAVALVKRLVVEWADAVAENFAPRAMKSFGLDYESLAAVAPGLVMISACLNGQTGPHKDYPGFGGQGSALSGWNWITGWADREPLGPFGTITDSLAPRYVAAALAAGLLHRRATGEGVYIDVAQVECGAYALSPWIADYCLDGTIGTRNGSRSHIAVPHGAFPCADEDGLGDRWVAIACHSDDDWARLAALIDVDDATLATFDARHARIDEVEGLVARYTSVHTRAEVAAALQSHGIEAVPVADFGDVFADEQFAHRGHFVALDHPVLGPGTYERSGIRWSDATAGYDRAAADAGTGQRLGAARAVGSRRHRDRPTPRRRRIGVEQLAIRFLSRLALLAAGVLVGLVTLLTLGRFSLWPIDLLANFRVQLLEASVLLTVMAAALRARIAFVVCALTMLVNGAVVAPSFVGSQPAARRDSPTLTIGHLNAQSGTIDVVAFRKYLTELHPGLFVILNPNPATVHALQRNAAGYAVIPVTNAGGAQFAWAVALTRVPIFGVRHPPEAGMPRAAMEAIVEMGNTPIAVLFLHTDSPYTPARNAHLHRALAAAARWSRGVRLPHVVEGDLNTTPWSAAFDTLLRNGRLHNSLVGFGIQASWPSAYALLRIPIDNSLLSTDLTAVGRGTGPSFGSEHRSLHVTIALRR